MEWRYHSRWGDRCAIDASIQAYATLDPAFLELTRSPEKNIIFVTNNATKSREDLKKKFDKLGIQAEVVRKVPDLDVH
jgi:hypothetical protein